MGKGKKRGRSTAGLGSLSCKDPINKIRSLKLQNDKAMQSYKPDWEDKYEYGLSDW